MKSTNDTSLIQTYLDYCKYNKRLDEKTVKAYAIDLRHFYMALPDQPLISRTPQAIEAIIQTTNGQTKNRFYKSILSSLGIPRYHRNHTIRQAADSFPRTSDSAEDNSPPHNRTASRRNIHAALKRQNSLSANAYTA